MQEAEDVTEAAVEWLLSSEEPAVRHATLTEVMGEDPASSRAQAARDGIVEGRLVRGLLAGQDGDGGFGVHPYKKWTGAHWRLVSLVDLGIPTGHPGAVAAAEGVLRWLTGSSHRGRIVKIRGLTRRCASQEGNALGVASRLGLTDDPRVQTLAADLQTWQWPDGGWNCDKSEDARHASFHESLIPTWGLWEYHRAKGDEGSLRAARTAAEFFLRHGLFRSETTGEVIHPEWTKLHHPPYWHYDVLQGLRVMGALGKLRDPRAQEALDLLESRRLPDGRWRPGGYWWRPPGSTGSHTDVVDWGRGGPSEMITLNALRVLRGAGRLG